MLLGRFLPAPLRLWHSLVTSDVWTLFYELGDKGGIFATNVSDWITIQFHLILR